MFKIHQIITSSILVRHFSQIAHELEEEPQALLVTLKRGQKLVLVNAEIFQELFEFRYSADVAAAQDAADSEMSIVHSIQNKL